MQVHILKDMVAQSGNTRVRRVNNHPSAESDATSDINAGDDDGTASPDDVVVVRKRKAKEQKQWADLNIQQLKTFIKLYVNKNPQIDLFKGITTNSRKELYLNALESLEPFANYWPLSEDFTTDPHQDTAVTRSPINRFLDIFASSSTNIFVSPSMATKHNTSSASIISQFACQIRTPFSHDDHDGDQVLTASRSPRQFCKRNYGNII